MSETNGNTPTSASMRGGACSPLSGGDGGYGGQSLPGAPALTHGDVWEAVNAANRDEAEKTYGEDSVRVLRVVLPGAPRFDSSSVSHGDSGCVPAGGGGGCDSHGCRGVVGERASQTVGDTGGIADGVSCGMPGGRVERDAGTAVAAPTIGVLAGDADTHGCGRCASGGAGADENIHGHAGRGVDCCGGEDGSAFIDTAPSPQQPTRRIPDAGVLLFDAPVVLERRYIATPPSRNKETPGFSSAGAATGVDVSVGEEAGAPLSVLVKPRKDASNSTTGGDSCGDTTSGAEPSSDGDNECRERHQEVW